MCKLRACLTGTVTIKRFVYQEEDIKLVMYISTVLKATGSQWSTGKAGSWFEGSTWRNVMTWFCFIVLNLLNKGGLTRDRCVLVCKYHAVRSLTWEMRSSIFCQTGAITHETLLCHHFDGDRAQLEKDVMYFWAPIRIEQYLNKDLLMLLAQPNLSKPHPQSWGGWVFECLTPDI